MLGLAAPGPAAAQTVTLSLSKDRLVEADVATAITVTATLSASQTTATTIALSLAGTATKDTDYTVTGTQSITVAANATTGTTTLTIDPTADTIAEADGETIIVQKATTVTLTVNSATLTLYKDWDENDRVALAAFYDATGGDNWKTSTNWKTSAALNIWHGIRVTSGRVTSILLGENNLTGTLPTELGNLDSLSILQLKNNQLSGSIPLAINDLTDLTEIKIFDNQLSGPIPDLSALTKLEEIDLRINQLSGSMPALTALTKLKKIFLRANQLTGAIPDLSTLPSTLTNVVLTDNLLTGQITASQTNPLPNAAAFQFDYNQSVCLPDTPTHLTTWYNGLSNKDAVEVHCKYSAPTTAPTLTADSDGGKVTVSGMAYTAPSGFTTSHYEVQYRPGTTGRWLPDIYDPLQRTTTSTLTLSNPDIAPGTNQIRYRALDKQPTGRDGKIRYHGSQWSASTNVTMPAVTLAAFLSNTSARLAVDKWPHACTTSGAARPPAPRSMPAQP